MPTTEGRTNHVKATLHLKPNPGQVPLLEAFLSVVERCIQLCLDKDYQYKSSWKQRGGQGAYFTAVRPMDRFHSIAEAGLEVASTGSVNVPISGDSTGPNVEIPYLDHKKADPYDIFKIIEIEDQRGQLYHDGTLSACTQDIFVYMMLIMAEMHLRKQVDNYQSAHPVRRPEPGITAAGSVEIPTTTADKTQLPHGAHWLNDSAPAETIPVVVGRPIQAIPKSVKDAIDEDDLVAHHRAAERRKSDAQHAAQTETCPKCSAVLARSGDCYLCHNCRYFHWLDKPASVEQHD